MNGSNILDTFNCQFCNNTRATTINTYKHHWVSCNNCGNVFRYRKDKYLMSYFLPKSLAKISPILKRLVPNQDILDDGSKIYDYFSSMYDIGLKETKYRNEFDDYLEKFAKYNIDINKKNILDISGGPGYFVQNLSKFANKAVMTEYNEIAVNLAKEKLSIDTVQFDFNKDDIDKIVQDKFDIVFIRYAINFCLDIRGFLSSLKKVLHEEAIIYVSFVPPSLGTCLRWQLDDYTYPILYNPETIARLFAEEGFFAYIRDDDGTYHYWHKRPLLVNLGFSLYQIAAIGKNVNRDLLQKNLILIFKKNV